MVNFALIVLGLASGLLFRRFRVLERSAAQVVNTVIVYLSLPALILQVVPRLTARPPGGAGLFAPLSMAWIAFVLTAILLGWLGKRRRWGDATTGALILTVGLGNTSFVGIPLLDALYGPESLPTIVIIDQTGSFLCLATLGSLTASIYAGTKASWSKIARRVLTFPPFLALILSIVAGLALPEAILSPSEAFFAKLAATLVPLSLISVGLQLEVSLGTLRRKAEPLAVGLVAKLFLLPMIFTGLYVGALGSLAFSTKITLLESAMAPMIMAAILANDSKLDAELSSLMVGVGIPISLVTVPAWDWVLTHVVMR